MVYAHLLRPRNLAAGLELSARQNELLDHLEQIILDEGFRRLTVESLAKRLRCSRRTLYELAPSKDELVLLVLDRLLRRMGVKAMERVRALEGAADRLYAYMTRTNAEIRRGGQQLWVDVAAQPAVRRLVDDHYRYAAAVVAGLIQEGVRAGEFREVNAAVIGEVLGVALRHLQDPQVLARLGTSNAAANDEVFDLAMRGVTTMVAAARSPAAG